MQFAIGDNVVHPLHGPGRIIGLEQKELLDGRKRYYVIEIPTKDLTLFVPLRTIDELGVRPAMSRAKLSGMLDRLRANPALLPKDYKERQELAWEKLRTGRVMQVAEVVRDLTWHGRRLHLTKKDESLLSRGRKWLAAEMALVAGSDVSEMEDMIDRALAPPPPGPPGPEPRRSSLVPAVGNA
jgi:CarD family transcriptional regulator